MDFYSSNDYKMQVQSAFQSIRRRLKPSGAVEDLRSSHSFARFTLENVLVFLQLFSSVKKSHLKYK